jgi:hypothetical protein
LTQVAALGFPYGFDAEDKGVMSRGFVGNIAGTRHYSRFAAKPLVYALSFAAPRNLSGGPFLLGERICAVIVGNHQTTMLVFSDEERIEESGTISRVERYEAMNLGIAVAARTVLHLRLPDGVRLLDLVRTAEATVDNID